MDEQNIREMIVRDVSLPSLFAYIEARLPDTMPELREMVAFTDTELRAWQAAAENLKSIDATEEAIEEAVRNGQKWGVARIAGESKKGKLAYSTKKAHGNIYNSPVRDGVVEPKHQRLNMSRNEMGDAQQIASHPEAVERVIKKAVEDNEIPRKADVLNEITRDRNEKINTELRKNPPPKPDVNDLLDQCIKNTTNTNAILKEVMEYRDHCEIHKLDEFARLIKRTFEIIQQVSDRSSEIKLIQ